MEFDANLDYLTVSLRCQREWRETIGKLLETVVLDGKRRPWRFLQYQGYTVNTSEGHLAWGSSARGSLVQAGGMVAHALALRSEKWLPKEFKVTRMDIACTFALQAPRQLVGELAKDIRQEWRVIMPHPDKGGGTLYVGARVSDTFGRLYDKGAQLNKDRDNWAQLPPAVLWRAEIEYKKARAIAAYGTFKGFDTSSTRREWMANTVLTFFEKHGVALPIHPNSRSIVSVSSRAIDDIRTIKWMHDQVRPAVVRLAEKGKLPEVANALGLDAAGVELAEVRLMGDLSEQFSYFDKLTD